MLNICIFQIVYIFSFKSEIKTVIGTLGGNEMHAVNNICNLYVSLLVHISAHIELKMRETHNPGGLNEWLDAHNFRNNIPIPLTS